MPRSTVNDSQRLAIRVKSADKALILRAVELAGTDLATFVTDAALKAARSTLKTHERVRLSQRDGLALMELLENPPPPNARLKRAARAYRERS